jgi:rubredoxin
MCLHCPELVYLEETKTPHYWICPVCGRLRDERTLTEPTLAEAALVDATPMED